MNSSYVPYAEVVLLIHQVNQSTNDCPLTNRMSDCQVGSIQTISSRTEKDDFTKPNANIIFLDEAHRSVSKSFTNFG